MSDERTTLQQLRARVQARMEAITRADGETWTPDDQRLLCDAIMNLGEGCDGGPMRLRATPEETLAMDDYLAWVAATFAEEIALLDQTILEIQQRANPERVDDDERNQELTQALTDFVHGTDDPAQLPLLP